MKPVEEEAPEGLLERPCVDRWQWQELAVFGEDALSDQAMGVWVEIGIGTRALKGEHTSGSHVGALEKLFEADADRIVGRAGQKPEQAPVPLEQPPECTRDRECVVPVDDRSEELFHEFLGEQGGTLGLARWAKLARAAGE